MLNWDFTEYRVKNRHLPPMPLRKLDRSKVEILIAIAVCVALYLLAVWALQLWGRG